MKKLIIGVLIVTSVFITGCGEVQETDSRSKLPINATNIRNLGNGWITFDLDEYTFMYHRSLYGYNGYECVTQVK